MAEDQENKGQEALARLLDGARLFANQEMTALVDEAFAEYRQQKVLLQRRLQSVARKARAAKASRRGSLSSWHKDIVKEMREKAKDVLASRAKVEQEWERLNLAEISSHKRQMDYAAERTLGGAFPYPETEKWLMREEIQRARLIAQMHRLEKELYKYTGKGVHITAGRAWVARRAALDAKRARARRALSL